MLEVGAFDMVSGHQVADFRGGDGLEFLDAIMVPVAFSLQQQIVGVWMQHDFSGAFRQVLEDG